MNMWVDLDLPRCGVSPPCGNDPIMVDLDLPWRGVSPPRGNDPIIKPNFEKCKVPRDSNVTTPPTRIRLRP